MTLTSPPRIIHSLPFRMTPPVLTNVMGTTGTFSFAATENAPFLKSAMVPSTDRVPSGKNKTEPFFRNVSRQIFNVSICDLRSVRFSGTCPVKNIDHPMIGMIKLLVLEMNLNGRLKWNKLKMSMNDWWFATYTAASSWRGRCSLPSTVMFTNGVVEHIAHRSLTNDSAYRRVRSNA